MLPFWCAVCLFFSSCIPLTLSPFLYWYLKKKTRISQVLGQFFALLPFNFLPFNLALFPGPRP